MAVQTPITASTFNSVFGDLRAHVAKFASVADALSSKEETIVAELIAVQGKPADIGGYYKPDASKIEKIMRPSATLNAVIDSLN